MEHKEWLEWRKKGLGASDAPIIMGVSPWKTAFELWLEKTGQKKSETSNFAMERGNKLEPKARAYYEAEHDIDMPAQLFEHPKKTYIRASLDGWNAEKQLILEIKCPGKDDHKTAIDGIVPEKYYPQLQHQMLVTGAKMAHYFSFDGTKGVTVKVDRDEEYIKKLEKKLDEFWNFVTTKTPTPLSEEDYLHIEEPLMQAKLCELKAIKIKIDELKENFEKLKTEITSAMLHPRIKYNGVKIAKVIRKGSINYSKVPELKCLDLEQFRGKEVYSYRVTVD